MIINIRGTGGSGKSWVVKQVMARFPASPYDSAIFGHVVNNNTFVLGPYNTNLTTEGTDVVNRKHTQDQLQGIILAGGGCDNLPKVHRRQDDLQTSLASTPYPNAIFEGLLVSGIYGRYREMARGIDYRWVFLDTPLETCLANTRARRVAAGKPTEFNPSATISKYNSVRNILSKASADKLWIWEISSEKAVDMIAGWIV